MGIVLGILTALIGGTMVYRAVKQQPEKQPVKVESKNNRSSR